MQTIGAGGAGLSGVGTVEGAMVSNHDLSRPLQVDGCPLQALDEAFERLGHVLLTHGGVETQVCRGDDESRSIRRVPDLSQELVPIGDVASLGG
jgi:hypothetical protein